MFTRSKAFLARRMLKRIPLILFPTLFVTSTGFSQTPIDVNSINASYEAATNSTNSSTAKTLCGVSSIKCGEPYTETYGASDGVNQGNLVLSASNAFSILGSPYNLKFESKDVSYQRVNNPVSMTTGVDLIHYESGVVNSVGEPNNTIDILPSKQATSVDVIKDRVLNDGNESIFHNYRTSYQLVNTDVERIDFIFKAGMKTPTPQNAGFLVAERGGNDNIKLAAITKLSNLGSPEEYGDLSLISSNDWAIGINRLLQTMSFVSDDNGANYGPFAANSQQYLNANFMSLQDLGVAPDQVIYGYSIFPADVDPVANPAHNLADPSTFPNNTAGTNGGLDLIYGSGAFDNDNKLALLPSANANAIPSLSTYGLILLSLLLFGFSRKLSLTVIR